MGLVTKWSGSKWVDIDPVKWSGSKWVNVEVLKCSTNGTWGKITSQQYTKEWECTWSQTYRANDAKRTDYRSGKLCQGESSGEIWGRMRSLAGFPSMKSTLAGSKIISAKVYLKNEHWYYTAGGKAVLGHHNHSSEPTTFSHTKHAIKTESYTSRGQAKWIDMPALFGEGLRDGTTNGFSTYYGSSHGDYYGVFYGADDGSNKPKIKVTYEK